MSQGTTSPLTLAQVIRRRTGRRRDSDESSSSPRDDDYDEKKKPVNSNFSFDYSRIPYNSNAHLLSISLGKPPHFDG
jgi:hypothetical protein